MNTSQGVLKQKLYGLDALSSSQ